MNIIWVTMMYGSGLPILFPIAFVSFVLIYVMDIYMLFRVYRVPPKFDSDLHLNQIVTMSNVVILFLAFSTW
jgi:IS4 transposase